MKIRGLLAILLMGITINLFSQLPKYLYGVASYYSDEYAGKKTASGDLYDPVKMTAAHKTLPFGTVVEVENLENGKKVIVMINDRGPVADGRLIDLSRSAAESLDFIKKGTSYVMVTMIKLGNGNTAGVNLSDYDTSKAPMTNTNSMVSPTSPKPIMTEKLSNGIISIDYYVTNVVTKVLTKTNAIFVTNKIIKVVTNVYTNAVTSKIQTSQKVVENDVSLNPIDIDAVNSNDNEFVIEEPFEEPLDPGIKTVKPNNTIKQPENNITVKPADTAGTNDVIKKTNTLVPDKNVVDLNVPIDDLTEVNNSDIEDLTIDVPEDKVAEDFTIDVPDDKVIEDKGPVVIGEVTPDILIAEDNTWDDTAISQEKSIIYDEIEIDVQNVDTDPVKPNKNVTPNKNAGKTDAVPDDKIKVVSPDELSDYKIATDKMNVDKVTPDKNTVKNNIQDDLGPIGDGEKYLIQVGAFKDLKNAQKLYDKLKGMGYNVIIRDSVVKGVLYYRVRIGYYDSLDTALMVANKMKAMNLPALMVKITVQSADE